MSDDFDPYRKWLAIPPDEQPPNHYRLLGIPLLEDDPDVIENAANRQMAHVRTYQSGRHGPLSQKILNELSVAKICLLNPDKKVAYDATLREKEAKSERTPSSPPPPRAAAAPQAQAPDVPPSPSAPVKPAPVTPSIGPKHLPGTPEPAAGAVPAVGVRPRSSTIRRPRRRKSSPVGWIMLGIVVLSGLIVVLYLVVTRDQNPRVPKTNANSGSTPQANNRIESGGGRSGGGALPLNRDAPSRPAVPPRVDPIAQTDPAASGSGTTSEPDTAANPTEPATTEDRPNPEYAVRFDKQIAAAREAMGQRELGAAADALRDAARFATSEDQRTKLEHHRTLLPYLQQFQVYVHQGIHRDLEEEEEFEFEEQSVQLVSRIDGLITYKIDGQTYASTEKELPTLHALAFASRNIGGEDRFDQAYAATFLALDRNEGGDPDRAELDALAKEYWSRAEMLGYSNPQIKSELGLEG